ncbi:MAG TPA: VOC family protein [Anaerolineae bacterium]|jgi:catechol 2,3-dioxygenase-like lactoylglutathione lyase family enzyme
MKVKLIGITVQDQDKALRFYTEVLGFVKKLDMPAGPYRWITVVSPEAPHEIEVALEPDANPAARAYQEAMHQQGIPLLTLTVDDLQKEFERLTKLGVVFTVPPTKTDWGASATLDDTCGNLVWLMQVAS